MSKSSGRDFRRLSRGDFLQLTGGTFAGAALLGASGCGGSGGSGDGGSETLTFSAGHDSTGTVKELINKFNDQNKGDFQVEFREMAADTGQYFDQLQTEFQGGGGDIDVISGDVIWPAQFAVNGWILDLSDRFTEEDRAEFLPAPIESNTYEGKIYGVPWFTDAGLLYYRQDLLEQSGISEVPATWDEFKEVAKQVAQETGTKNGFVFQGAQYEGGVVDGLEYIWTHGGDVLDGETVIIDSPEAIAGLTMERSMITDGVAPEAVTTYKEPETEPVFLGDDAVFCRTWPYLYGLASDPSISKIKPEQMGVAPIPAGPGGQSYSGLGGWNLFINAASDKQDQAWKFIQFLTDPEQQKLRALKDALLPPRKTLYDDPEILEKVPVMSLSKEVLLNNARPRPLSPYYGDMSLAMAEQFNAALKGDVTPEQAIKTLQSELQGIIEQGG
jgi:multiple sugar transport system substrate-binding protein